MKVKVLKKKKEEENVEEDSYKQNYIG